MTTKTQRVRRSAQFMVEAGGWLTMRRPAKRSGDPLELLTASQKPRPGNLRYATDGVEVYQIAELRDPTGMLSLSGSNDRTHESLFLSGGTAVDLSHVAEILSECAGEWTQPEGQTDQWQAVVNDVQGDRCEPTASAIAGGVEVTALLASWEDEISEASREAVAHLLAAAHGRLRFVRFQLQADRVNAVSFAAAERLDVDLPESVAAVATAVGRIGNSVRALLLVDVADAYVATACERK